MQIELIQTGKCSNLRYVFIEGFVKIVSVNVGSLSTTL